jgi:hypothetical protein
MSTVVSLDAKAFHGKNRVRNINRKYIMFIMLKSLFDLWSMLLIYSTI